MDRETPQDSIHPASSETDVLSYARHQVFTESDHLSAAVQHLNLELVQRGSGPFRGDLYSGALGGTMVQFIHLNQPTFSRAINAPDRLAVLIQLRGSEPCIWNGYESQEVPRLLLMGPATNTLELSQKSSNAPLFQSPSNELIFSWNAVTKPPGNGFGPAVISCKLRRSALWKSKSSSHNFRL